MTVRLANLATDTDAIANRVIWRATQPSLAAIWPEAGGVPQISTNAAGLAQMKAMMAVGQCREWEDATLTINGFLLSGPPARWEGLDSEEARCLMPRPSISVTLFRTVCKELLDSWFRDCIARGVQRCWGKFPANTPALMLKVFTDMAAANGAVDVPDPANKFRLWKITPQQGLVGLEGVIP